MPPKDEAEPRAPERELKEIRRILFGPDGQPAERIRAVEERLDDASVRAQEVGRVLPQAVLLRAKQDKALTQALASPVSEALQKSVEQNPKPLVDALFPVIGPAIRKSIAHALRSMVQQLNQAVEYSLSPRALLWRLEAMRTGKSFGEVVLLKTLTYRVEQVFLIHTETGLLLRHVTAPEVATKDADMVSAMLTAIRDFVRDSFDAGDEEGVESLRVGEHAVWVAQGRRSVLAAVIRGEAPEELRTTMETAIESIEGEMAAELDRYEGDGTPFEAVQPHLESCLGQATRQKRSELVPLVTFFVAIAIVLGLGYLYFESRVEQKRWEAYVRRLNEEPGLVVTGAERRDGAYHVTGLRDPLARPPEELLGPLADEDVRGHWQGYASLEPAFVLSRARGALRPPESVTLALDGTTLVARGAASRRWLDGATHIAPAINGVARLDASAVLDLDRTRLDEIAARVAALRPGPGNAPRFAALLREALDAADAAGARIRFEVRGEGAEAFAEELRRASIPAEKLVPRPSGETLSLRVLE